MNQTLDGFESQRAFQQIGRQVHILLVKVSSAQAVIEIWPLRNLLIPRQILLPDSDLDQKCCKLCCDSKYIIIWCSDALYVYCTSTTQFIHKICLDFECFAVALSIKTTAFLASNLNQIYSLNLQNGVLKSIKRIPPLCEASPSALLVRQSFFAVACESVLFYFPLDNSFTSRYFDTQLSSREQLFEVHIILMEPQHIAVFYRKRQIICVFLFTNPNRPEHKFSFTKAEHVVDVCWFKNSLYTLTDNGILSKWILMANGRKFRERYLETRLKDCFKILAIENDKFFVCCKDRTIGVKWNT